MTLQLAPLLLERASNNGMKKNEENGIAVLHCQSLEVFLHLLLHLPQVSNYFVKISLYLGQQLIATEMQCEPSSETESIFSN